MHPREGFEPSVVVLCESPKSGRSVEVALCDPHMGQENEAVHGLLYFDRLLADAGRWDRAQVSLVDVCELSWVACLLLVSFREVCGVTNRRSRHVRVSTAR